MYNCRNCGASLRYDIEEKKLVCDHCGSRFDPEDDFTLKEAKASEYFGMQVYTCPNCGARMMHTAVNAVACCPWCGTQTVMEDRVENFRRPKYIIPFAISRQECRRQYQKSTSGRFLAPKEFRSSKYLETFQPVYMPYWLFDVQIDRNMHVPVFIRTHEGNYDYFDNYLMNAVLHASVRMIPYEASRACNDITARGLLPFDAEQIRPFHPGYLCGFMADIPDVPAQQGNLYSRSVAAAYVMRSCNAEAEKKNYGSDPSHTDQKLEYAETMAEAQTKAERALFPMWFLTWHHKNRSAYAVVNGLTGKVSAQLPVDLRRYLTAALIIALPLMLAFRGILSLSTALAAMTSFTAMFTGRFISSFFRRFEEEKEAEDRLRADAEKKGNKDRKANVIAAARTLMMLFFLIMPGILLFNQDALTANVYSGWHARIFSAVALADLLLTGYAGTFVLSGKEEMKQFHRDLVPCFAVAGINLLISVIAPVRDLPYVLTAVLTALVLVLVNIHVIQRYNRFFSTDISTLFSEGSGKSFTDASEPAERKDDSVLYPDESIADIRQYQEKLKEREEKRKKAENSFGTNLMVFLIIAAVLGTIFAEAWLSFTGNSDERNFSASDLAIIEIASADGHQAVLKDDAGLFSEEDQQEFAEMTADLLSHTDVIFLTETGNETAENAVEAVYQEQFDQSEPVTAFVLDPKNREFEIVCEGRTEDILSENQLQRIRQEAYRFFYNNQYEEAVRTSVRYADLSYRHPLAVAGIQIARNLLVSFLAGILLLDFHIWYTYRKRRYHADLTAGTEREYSLSDTEYIFQGKTKKYNSD